MIAARHNTIASELSIYRGIPRAQDPSVDTYPKSDGPNVSISYSDAKTLLDDCLIKQLCWSTCLPYAALDSQVVMNAQLTGVAIPYSSMGKCPGRLVYFRRISVVHSSDGRHFREGNHIDTGPNP